MFFARDSLVYQHLSVLRNALVDVVERAVDLEREVATRHRVRLLVKYREVVREFAKGDFELVASYWKELRKEQLGSLGEPVARDLKSWTGVYRSAFIDRLASEPRERPLSPFPIDFLNRLEPSTGLDPELAYGVLGQIAELRRLEAQELAADLAHSCGAAPPNVQSIAAAMAQRFGLVHDPRGAKGRPIFVLKETRGVLDLGICPQEGRLNVPGLSYFEFVALERAGTRRLKSSGLTYHAAIGFEHLFPGYASSYGVYSSADQLRLNVYAAFCMFVETSRDLDEGLAHALH